MLRINDIKLELHENLDQLRHKIIKKTGVAAKELMEYTIIRESLDARKGVIKRVYTLDAAFADEARVMKRNPEIKSAPTTVYLNPIPGKEALPSRPVIIGFGPAGMLAALLLAEMGYRPIVLERGSSVEKRTEDIERFWTHRQLNPESNVQFGEGGAGTFSDGKLTSRSKDLRSVKVLEELARHGAPADITYKNKPHVGTDILKKVVVSLRQSIIEKGGEIRFDTRVTDFNIENGKVTSLLISNGETVPCGPVILAIGHSARDTFEKLHERGVQMTQKPFAVGVRIEQPQLLVDSAQYKRADLAKTLGAAEYFLTHQASNGRSAYTFCMCPGGEVVAAASEEGTVVTNGMSYYARAGQNANSALLVNVTPADFGSGHPLAGIAFQRELEAAAYRAGGSNYNAPAQRVEDFLNRKKSGDQVMPKADEGGVVKQLQPTYRPGLTFTDLSSCLPDFVIETLMEALPALNGKMQGFASPEAVMTAVESRTSSPVRIVRDENTLQAAGIIDLYPCGEGAGYAGGIVSSAIDGLRVAEKIIERYSPESAKEDSADA